MAYTNDTLAIYTDKPELKGRLIKFVNVLPKGLQYAIHNNLSADKKNYFDSIDMFFFHYRWYIGGDHKTLHRVFFEIRRFKQNKYYSDSLLLGILNVIEKDLLENELYELMPKHLNARKKIIRKFSLSYETKI